MNSKEIRHTFLDFFKKKGHQIVPSAPLVNKDDPTLMFVNAGMNPFKDYFLGTQEAEHPRVADTQKCLRVSGKHNDLEEVGRDSYHHTFFEMLGNWSFGDYFKQEAIVWAWELLTEVYGLPQDRLYVTIFEGDEQDGLEPDEEAANLWSALVPSDRILRFGKKDNFWEMGDTGPCGPCSEIHIDLRDEEARSRRPGAKLVNADDPLVVELWNLVFIQFDRKADGSLKALPARHVDTGMGFERLTMAIQGKRSNYETDIFRPFIDRIATVSGKPYTNRYDGTSMSDVATRVVADHLRAVAFAIADGQLPANTGAGYVIRRILRRAVRYYVSFLEIRQPFLHTLVPLLAQHFGEVFPGIEAQKEQVARIIQGEERTFLQTLENGLRRFESLETPGDVIRGEDAFELYDTYGFPVDLTRLLAKERGLALDESGFEKALAQQQERSRADAERIVGDWEILSPADDTKFLGYDRTEVAGTYITRLRSVEGKKKKQYQLVLDHTPFYPESGGQRGDSGTLLVGDESIRVHNTVKENNLIIHIVDRLPADRHAPVVARVDADRRLSVSRNHSATHLMHAALHRVLGEHALQKGQDVDDQRLRFDFAHFQKMTEQEIAEVENIVNERIRQNIPLEEVRDLPLEEAKAAGAMMLFGEKYGERVRMITFDPEFSRELCGGTHVQATGEIGPFKIISESAVAAGIRRIEAITARKVEKYLRGELKELDTIRELVKNPSQPARQVENLLEDNRRLRRELEKLLAQQASALKGQLLEQAESINGLKFIGARLALQDSGALKNLAYQLEQELGESVILLGAEINDKPQLLMVISRPLTEKPGLHAGNLIRELAREIKGGGGGQPFFATAGGKDAAGIDQAIALAREKLKEIE